MTTLNTFAATALAISQSKASKADTYAALSLFVNTPAIETFLTNGNARIESIDTHAAKHFSRVIGFAMAIPGHTLAETHYHALKTILLHGLAGKAVTHRTIEASQTRDKVAAGTEMLYSRRPTPTADAGSWGGRVMSVAKSLGIVTEEFRGTFKVNMQSTITKALLKRFELVTPKAKAEKKTIAKPIAEVVEATA